MKQTITQSDFHDAFRNYDRLENFSYEARELLFDYFEDIDEDMDLDVIAICCDYNENSAESIASNYMDAEEYAEFKELDEEEQINGIRDYLENNTSLIGETSTGFVYADF